MILDSSVEFWLVSYLCSSQGPGVARRLGQSPDFQNITFARAADVERPPSPQAKALTLAWWWPAKELALTSLQGLTVVSSLLSITPGPLTFLIPLPKLRTLSLH